MGCPSRVCALARVKGCDAPFRHRNPAALVYDGADAAGLAMGCDRTMVCLCVRTCARHVRMRAYAYGKEQSPISSLHRNPASRPRLCRLAQKGFGAGFGHRNPSQPHSMHSCLISIPAFHLPYLPRLSVGMPYSVSRWLILLDGGTFSPKPFRLHHFANTP